MIEFFYSFKISACRAFRRFYHDYFFNQVIYKTLFRPAHSKFSGGNLLLYLRVPRMIKLTVVLNEEYQYYQLHTKLY